MGEQEQPEAAQLLGQCKICIMCSADLSEDVAMQLSTEIESRGGEVTVHHPPAPLSGIEQFTHIISTTVDFPEYQQACDALIPVVRPQWLNASITKNKLSNPRQYSPDPRLFFSGVVVTCGDIPDGDKDAIIGGVLAMGGIYSPRITQQVTHLVDLTLDSDKAKLVLAKRLPITIVLPHWFDDCLKLGRRLGERPYQLPNPEILNARPDDPIRSAHNKDIAGAVSPMPHDLPEALTEKTRELNVFQNKRVMLSSDLGIGPHLSSSIEELIVKGGGTVTKNLDKADTYICRYREGPEYRAASRANKEVGNLAWLYYMITNNKWTSPLRRLLHYPVSREGIPGFKGLRISLSNYAGEARAYLEHLIIAAGAECTKTLKNDNTHLITAHGTSEKCSAAREWGLHVVNHLWLEESYAKWKMMPVSDPRYTHFPKRTNLGEVVGQTRLDRDVLERIFFPADSADEDARVMQQKDQNVVSKTETAKPSKRSSKEKSESDKKSNKASSAPAKPTTPSRTVAAEGKENATPLTTSTRKSKEAAAARLQEIVPDMLLYEKEKKRAGGVVYGGRRSEDLIVPNNGKKRRSIDAQETGDEAEEDKADAKRQKKTKTPIKMYMVVTGYERWAGNAKREDADRRQLRELGIVIAPDAKKCTHLAAPAIRRTPKFVSALAYAPEVVRTDYLTQCLAKKELLDTKDFALVDEASEKKFGFSLAESRERAAKNKNKLLRGYRICCVENIHGGFDTYKSIAEANGAECTLFRGRVSMNFRTRASSTDSAGSSESDDVEQKHLERNNNVYLLSAATAEHAKLWPRFRQLVRDAGKTPRIVDVNWLLDIAMSQEIRWKDEYELDESKITEEAE